MEFERLDASGKNAQKGSKVLKVIHDKTFIIDLFVRESIQNSLDAHDNKSNDVLVEYIIGDFACNSLATELNGLNDCFYEKYGVGRSKFIAIRDLHTTGLTGGFRKTENEALGNLYKLVFDTFESKGSGETGGSWGLGKTMYSLLGIGIVIYYSRIKTASGYESRLVGALIENEKSPGHISQGNTISCSGIGWWGVSDSYEPTEIIPITNDEQIRTFLKIFNILPFENDEVGTCVIVPYVDIDSMLECERIRLQRNAREDDDLSTSGVRPWLNKIVDYLSVAILRWYFPRIDNVHYKFGPRLSVKIIDAINNVTTPISLVSDYRLFRVMQALYNRAAYENTMPFMYNDCLSNLSECTPIVKRVNFTQHRLNAGSVAFVKISSKYLQGPLPYELLGMQESCRTIIGNTRSLGMIVWYENANFNTNLIQNDEWILAQFVLNGKQKLENYPDDENTLEKYIRKTEGASHNGWNVESGNIANLIKKNIRSKILESFSDTPDSSDSHANALGRELAKILVPEQRTTAATSRRGGGSKIKAKAFEYTCKVTKYNPFTIELVFDIAPSFDKDIQVELQIASEGSSISFKEWKKDVSSYYPFYIKTVNVFSNKNKATLDEDSDKAFFETRLSKCTCTLLSQDGYPFGLKLSNPTDENHVAKKFAFGLKLTNSTDENRVAEKFDQKVVIKVSIVLEIEDNKYMPSIEVSTSNKE